MSLSYEGQDQGQDHVVKALGKYSQKYVTAIVKISCHRWGKTRAGFRVVQNQKSACELQGGRDGGNDRALGLGEVADQLVPVTDTAGTFNML